MPPKRKAATAAATTPATKTTAKGRGRGKAATIAVPATSDPGPTPKKAAGRGRGKKQANEAPAEAEKPSTARQAITTLQASSDTAKKKTAKPDSYFPHSASATVVEDYDCMLNQTNIGQNNNKYYVIQVLAVGASYYAWNRWGRVGEPGQNAIKGPTKKDDAIADFKKKFKDKTGNDWDNRANFTPKSGKYTLIEMDGEEEEEAAPVKKPRMDMVDGKQQLVAASKLDAQTQWLMKFIFDNDMFRDAMKSMDIDVKKMPLGKLSKSQIAKGFEVLEEIEQCLTSSNRSRLSELSSRFYTLIPHDFGRKVPPVIGDAETLRSKMDMLLVLGDIELAQQLNKEKDKSLTGDEQLTAIPNPLDVSYDLLECDLKLVDKKSENYKIIENYLTATGYHDKSRIQNVWEVRRKSEGKRFSTHDKIDNRKLLWHGTKVAVVAAILKGGLRIMPHSGGRMGKGIYFASEQSKSAGYVGSAGNGIGIMFLNEVALGNEHHVTVGDSRLTVAPPGYDSIIAIGSTEPDPKKDVTIVLDGKKVKVPQGKPIQNTEGKGSHFSQSEYLIYKESQNFIRYMLTIKFN